MMVLEKIIKVKTWQPILCRGVFAPFAPKCNWKEVPEIKPSTSLFHRGKVGHILAETSRRINVVVDL